MESQAACRFRARATTVPNVGRTSFIAAKHHILPDTGVVRLVGELANALTIATFLTVVSIKE